MGVKLKYEDIKSIINKEDKLISKEYNNNKELLEIQCGKCNLIYKQNYDRYKQCFRHKECKNKIININKKENNNGTRKLLITDIIRECIWCKKIIMLKKENSNFVVKNVLQKI